MKFTVSVLSALAIAVPTLATELAKPLSVSFVKDAPDTVVSGGNVDKSVEQPHPDFMFTETGQSGTINISGIDWDGDYHYKCEVEVVKDPGTDHASIFLSGDENDLKYIVDKFDQEIIVHCDKAPGLGY